MVGGGHLVARDGGREDYKFFWRGRGACLYCQIDQRGRFGDQSARMLLTVCRGFRTAGRGLWPTARP